MIGRTLAHYRILQELGSGGMGRVYLALDTTLDRRVALKVLPDEVAGDPGRLKRFEREARTVAAFNHPNIVTLHAIEMVEGVRFITMEHVEGKTLDELIPARGMKLDQLFELAIPLADALATAHSAAVTHRDLKPSNVMVTKEGRLKILDFGLAKPTPKVGSEDETLLASEELTGEGRIVGTLPYMSPEQIEGRPLDGRSDIFSLGVMLYEMATGSRPFGGESSTSLLAAILKDAPRSVTELRGDLPRQLARVVEHCLEKDAAKRFQSALDVRNELEALRDELAKGGASAVMAVPAGAIARRRLLPWIVGAIALAAIVGGLWLAPWRRGGSDSRAPGVEERRRIAVLPFQNLGAAEDEFFADGLSEEVTSRLGSVHGLGVISRTSAMHYKNVDRPAREIGRELGVDYLLAGTVRWEKSVGGASRVRVTPELVRVADDSQLWSSRYDRELSEIFAVQSDIAREVIRALGLTLGEPEREELEARPTENLDAYQAYLRGVELWNQPGFDLAVFARAAATLERALELDPGFLQAATVLTEVYGTTFLISQEAKDSEAAGRALALAEAVAPDHPLVRIARGYYLYFCREDYAAAFVEFEAASGANPNLGKAFEAMGYIRRRQGRFEEAAAHLEQAIELDPYSVAVQGELARTLTAKRDFARADEAFVRAIAMAPDSTYYYSLRAELALSWRGDVAAAREMVDNAPGTSEPEWAWLPSEVDVMAHDLEAARERLARISIAALNQQSRFKTRILELQVLAALSAQKDLDRVLSLAEDEFRGVLARAPKSSYSRAALGLVYAYRGRPGEALAELDTAIGERTADHFANGQLREFRARALVVLGRLDEAMVELRTLLADNYDAPLTPHDLELDPAWDALRERQDFEALLTKPVGRAGA
jgi:non-specific serine/threonine protein kinase